MVAQIETGAAFIHSTPEPLFSLNGRTRGIYGNREAGRRFTLAPDGNRFIAPKPGTDAQTAGDDAVDGLILVENWFEELKESVPIP